MTFSQTGRRLRECYFQRLRAERAARHARKTKAKIFEDGQEAAAECWNKWAITRLTELKLLRPGNGKLLPRTSDEKWDGWCEKHGSHTLREWIRNSRTDLTSLSFNNHYLSLRTAQFEIHEFIRFYISE